MITKLSIRGYKSIENQEVSLDKINILIGGNGIGKTNFISVFDLMLKSPQAINTTFTIIDTFTMTRQMARKMESPDTHVV